VVEGSSMKDLSSTSFGLVIAYLLPGFAGFFALSFWSSSIQAMFFTFVEAQSNVGRFLLVILCSLVIGLELSVVRFAVFEKLICKKMKRDQCDFSQLAIEPKFLAFRGTVDEFYRYHQFWGGMAIVVPFLAWGLIGITEPYSKKWLVGIVFLALELFNIVGAYAAFKNYIDTASRILSKSVHA
jgi:hypothetical protein